MDMTSLRHGWAWTTTGFYRTVTGGRQWSFVSVPAPPLRSRWQWAAFIPVTTGGLVTVAVAHPPAGNVWVVTGILRPGAATWQWRRAIIPGSSGFPPVPVFVTFRTTSLGALLWNIAPGMTQDVAQMVLTENGGASWTATPPVTLRGNVTGVSLLSGASGWLTATVPVVANLSAIDQPASVVYRATAADGWRLHPISVMIPPSLWNPSVEQWAAYPPIWWNAQEGLFVLQTLSATSTRIALEVTHDGGTVWASPRIQHVSSVVTPVLRLSSPTVAVYTVGSHVAVTTPGSQAWRPVRLPAPLADEVTSQTVSIAADFISTSTGWIVVQSDTGRLRVYLTSTGGTQWTSFQPTLIH